MSDSDSSNGNGGSGSERVQGWREGDVLRFHWAGTEWCGWSVVKVKGEGKAVLATVSAADSTADITRQ